MTNDDQEPDLKALFERTAAEPSSFELTRMAARARELPERLERVPRHLPRWSWAPAFAAFAALGALAFTLGEALSPDDEPRPAALPATVAPTAPPLGPSGDPSTRAAPASPAPETASDSIVVDDELEIDELPFNPDTDDDPFDLSIAEETELSR